MRNLWSDRDARTAVKSYRGQGVNEDLALRTYTTRLLGADPRLVQPGGGNTSVKTIMRDPAGQLADRVHLLGLDQLAFERPLLADVGQGSGKLDGTPLRIAKEHGLIEEIFVLAAGALPAIFDRRSPALAPRLDRRHAAGRP